MDGIGEWLRRKREELGFTIDDISQKTMYRPEIIRQVEEGRPGVFPAEVYLNVFLRAYASALRLDPEEVMRARKSEEERAREAIRNLKLEYPRRIRLRLGLKVAGAVAGVALLAVLVYLSRRSSVEHIGVDAGAVTAGADTATVVTAEVVSTTGSESQPERTAAQVESSDVAAKSMTEARTEQAESRSGRDEACLEVIAKGGFFMKLVCGSDAPIDGYLSRGDTLRIYSDDDFVIVSLTDRRQVTLLLDGEPYKLPDSLDKEVYNFIIPNPRARQRR